MIAPSLPRIGPGRRGGGRSDPPGPGGRGGRHAARRRSEAEDPAGTAKGLRPAAPGPQDERRPPLLTGAAVALAAAMPRRHDHGHGADRLATAPRVFPPGINQVRPLRPDGRVIRRFPLGNAGSATHLAFPRAASAAVTDFAGPQGAAMPSVSSRQRPGPSALPRDRGALPDER